MREIKLTQGKVALVDNIDYDYLMQWKWYTEKCRGRYFRAKREQCVADRRVLDRRSFSYIHTVIAKRMGINAQQIDHKDRNPLNNCRSNLRFSTYSQNGHNRSHNKNSTTGVKGVNYHKASGRYRARIELDGKVHSLGYFDTLKEAAAVVQHKREELVGEFTCH